MPKEESVNQIYSVGHQTLGYVRSAFLNNVIETEIVTLFNKLDLEVLLSSSQTERKARKKLYEGNTISRAYNPITEQEPRVEKIDSYVTRLSSPSKQGADGQRSTKDDLLKTHYTLTKNLNGKYCSVVFILHIYYCVSH